MMHIRKAEDQQYKSRNLQQSCNFRAHKALEHQNCFRKQQRPVFILKRHNLISQSGIIIEIVHVI